MSGSPSRNLGHLDFYQFVIAQATRIKSLNPSVLTDADLVKLVVTLLSFTEDFGKAILQVQKDQRSEKLVVKDKVRDNSAAALKAAIKNASYTTDPDEKSAVTDLTILLANYGDIIHMPYARESGAIDKLIADLESPTYKPMVEKTGISSRVERLKADNNTFKELFEDRRDDTIATSDALKAIDLERTVNEHYSLMCDYVLSNAKIKDDVQYSEALKIINTIRDEYNAKVAQSKAAKKEDENTPKK